MSERLTEILRQSRAVLLDFDGPVCSVFAGLPAPVVAARLKQLLQDQGAELPQDVAELDDPLKVLRRTAVFAPELVDKVETSFMAYEVEAAGCAEITPGVRELLNACAETGRPVVIVSNNSEPAIETFLGSAGLREKVAGVVGRPIGNPAEMKPHPRSLLRACEMVGVPPGEAVLIGDSDFDMQAAANAGSRSIAYADAPGKDVRLAQAGAHAVTTSMRDLAEAIRMSR
ncbi:HAD family hydrolase [Planomonospora sp. ID91781]|uniref:HAD family hydrolase n=1 Tax=Planomonospora sp. ID91781 TaxID=2738135 RepID=UPI0018C37068|nr:HAD family hydrolase [Planomonospora sp. ID91781]MBG0819313.1 HAD family hydrolase [Planomonospora sp. ID91781]